MMDTTEQVIREVQRRWNEAPSAHVIDFFSARHRIRQKRAAQWLRTYTRPMPPEAA